ncbi:unnamed protein product [[Candida] boidinii]|nr:unnamed protein product [[Candida] boidinii]
MNDEVFKLQNNKISINNKASISNPSNIFSSANGVQNPLRFDHKSVPYHLFTHSTVVIHLIRHLLSFGIKNSLTLKKSLKQLIILICLSLFNLYFKTREIILKVYLQICYNRLKSFIILNNNFDSSIVKLLKIYKDSNNDNLNSILSSNQNINNTVPAAAAATTATTPTKVTNTTTATNTSEIRYPKRKLQNSKMYTTNLLSNLIISFNNKTQNIVKFIDPEFLEKYLNIYQLDLISSNSNNNDSFNNSNINVNNFNLVNQSHNSNINDLKFITMLNYNDSFDEPSKSGTFTTIPQVSNNVTTTRLKPLRLRSFSSDYTNNSFYLPSLSDSNPSSPVISSPNMPSNLVNASSNSIYNSSTKPASSSINCPLNQTYNKIPTTSPSTARNFTIPTSSNMIQNQFKHQRHKSSAAILNRNRVSVSEQPENISTNNAIERGNDSILPVNIFRLYSNFQTIRKFFMCVLLSIFEKYIENKTNALTNQSRLFLNVLLKTFNLEQSAVLNSNQSSLKYLSIFNSLLLIIKLMEKFMLLFEAYIRELNEDELLSIPFGNLQQQQRQQSTSSTLSSVSSLSRNSNLLHTIVEEDLDSKEYIFRYLMKLTDEISNKLAFMQIQNQNRNDNDFSYNPNYPNNSERNNSYSTVDNSFNLENLTKIGDDINNLIDNYNDSILLLQQQVSKENELKNVELSSSNKQFNLNPSFSIISTNEDKSNPKRYSKESNEIDKRDSIGLNLNLIKVFDDSLNLQHENINTDINNNNRFSYNSATSSGYNTVVIHSNVDDNELNDNPQFSQNNKDDFKKNLEKLVIRQSSGFNDNQGLGLNNTELGHLVNNNTAISANLNSARNGLTASKIKRRSLILAGSNIDSPYEDDEDIEKEFEKNIINVGVSPLSDTSSYSFQKASHTVDRILI